MQSNIFYYHLLCVLQSLNLIVLLLDLEFQRFPLVGEGQPLLPELRVFNQVLRGIQGSTWKSRSFPLSTLCVLTSTYYPILWTAIGKEELVRSPQHVKDARVLLLDCLAFHQFQICLVDLVLKEP